MKSEDLKAQGLTEEQIQFVMAENGKDVNSLKAKLLNSETEKDTYKTQLGEVNAELTKFKDMDIEGIKASVETWKTKYETDTAALQSKLDAQVYGSALEKFVDGYQFTSELAKKAVVAELKEKGFKLDGSTLLGAKDFMEELKTNNPTAFAEEDTNKPPKITLPGVNNSPGGKKLSMTEVMALKNANPDMDITPYL